MNLNHLKSILSEHGCQKIFVKTLSPNDNSKNQVYLGGSFEVLNILPISDIKTEDPGDWNRERFKASLNFSWINQDGRIYPAPKSQLILYPKYPEVRFSGFLAGCENPPSELMTQRLAGRLLFFSVTDRGNILGFVVDPDSEIAMEYAKIEKLSLHGVFDVIELPQAENTREKLIAELQRIHRLDWILSKRLDKHGNVLPCPSPNCGGYTLEAELGITPNGYSEPDYLGWEVKQFGVSNLNKLDSAVITLMTPEPTHGYYVSEGVEAFIRKYGYKDIAGREDRMNFGGVHKIDSRHERTQLKLKLIGFDQDSGRIRNADGKIALLDQNDNEAASWSFSSLLLHWNRKHNQACYVPSISVINGDRKYKFGNNVILGIGTDFQLFLIQMALGNIVYDPGIKLENLSTSPRVKRRSQFRIKSKQLSSLYRESEIVHLE